MEDVELKNTLRGAIIFIAIFIVFGGLFLKIIINNFSYEDVSVGKRLDKKDTFLLLIVNEKSKNNTDIVECFKDNDLKVEIVNSDREKYYDDFLFKLGITRYEISEPSLLDIREGKVVSIMTDVKLDNNLNVFIDTYKDTVVK